MSNPHDKWLPLGPSEYSWVDKLYPKSSKTQLDRKVEMFRKGLDELPNVDQYIEDLFKADKVKAPVVLSNTKSMAKSNSVGTKSPGQQSGSGIGIAGNIIDNVGDFAESFRKTPYTETQSAINKGVRAVANIHPIAKIAVEGANMLDQIGAAFGASTDIQDENIARAAGAYGANKANEILTAIPGHGWIGGLIGMVQGELKTGPGDRYRMSSYTSDDYASGKVVFGKSKFQKYNDEVADWTRTKNIIGDSAQYALNNDMSQIYDIQNRNKYIGWSPKALLPSAKEGTKLLGIEECKHILSLNATIKKHKNGGVLEEANVIPTGALHKNKHHIEEVDPDLEGKITEKGIPVVAVDDNDTVISQTAEVEKEELIFNKTATEVIEDFYRKYVDNPSEDIAIDAGKYIADQILHNTIDKGKLINKTE